MRRFTLLPLLLCACATEGVETLDGTDGGVTSRPDASSRVPERHRPAAPRCDDTRATTPPDIPDPNPGPPYVECTRHAECTAGANGRCIGNSHDGWRCSYDQCFEDSDCAFVCECEGGFRGDHNICLTQGNCKVDADCGPGGFCSPTLGSCGDYTGTVGYYCHTPSDTCVDDADCGGYPSYCAYDPVTGRWACQDDHCAG